MINKIIKNQISIFANLSDFKAEPEQAQKLIATFHELKLMPSFFHEQNIATGERVRRIQLVSMDESLRITFGSNRIDITSEKALEYIANSNGFIEIAKKTIPLVFSSINKKSSRISQIASFLITDIDINESHKKFIIPFSIYEDSLPFEWNWKANSYTNWNDNEGNTEELNTISEVVRAQGEMRQPNNEIEFFDGLIINFDINTKATDTNTRFDLDDALKFLHDTTVTYESLLSSFTDAL